MKTIKTLTDRQRRVITINQDAGLYNVIIAPEKIAPRIACEGSLVECVRYARRVAAM